MWKTSQKPVFSISKYKNQAGFSLIELSIVLVIVGILLSLSMPVLEGQIERARIKKTKSNMVEIIDTLRSYQKINGKGLPTAADPKASGKSAGMAATKRYEGMVPYKTLGISESTARDGYGRPITYAVEPRFTGDIDDISSVLNANGIAVINGEGNSVIADDPMNGIALVLVSHGETGQGAYLMDGTHSKVTMENKEKKLNADGSLNFQTGNSEDMVTWIGKYQLLR